MSAGMSLRLSRNIMVTFDAPRALLVMAASQATLPPPTTTTRLPSTALVAMVASVLLDSRNSSAVSDDGMPSIDRPSPRPGATTTWSNSFFNFSRSVTRWLQTMLTPRSCILATSSRTRLWSIRSGDRKCRSAPPGSALASYSVTSYPRRCNSRAVESPAGPLPTTATV